MLWDSSVPGVTLRQLAVLAASFLAQHHFQRRGVGKDKRVGIGLGCRGTTQPRWGQVSTVEPSLWHTEGLWARRAESRRRAGGPITAWSMAGFPRRKG